MRTFALVSAFLAIFGSSHVAWGSRTIYTPQISKRTSMFRPTTAPPGAYMGVVMDIRLVLTNISSVMQSGTVELMKGSRASANTVNSYPPGSVKCDFYMCSSVGHSNASQPASLVTVLPAPITWQVAPHSIEIIYIGVVGHGDSNVIGRNMTVEVAANAKIDISQNDGALLGSVYFNMDGVGGTGCNGVNYSMVQATYDLPEERHFTPILINGGRPF